MERFMPSISDAIKSNHDQHRALLAAIAETSGSGEDRRAACEAFYYEVKSHAAAGEGTLYSKMISKTRGQDAARHSMREHQQLDESMEEINGTDLSSPEWLTRIKELKQACEHHIEEGEKRSSKAAGR